jgi:NAD(P)-dependent dehydrogenase (short-subunit alcohol dehydrogenase family)
MKRFAGKVAWVTGASSGIGRAAALAFAREGAKVVVSARREPEGVAVVKQIHQEGGTAIFVGTNVAEESHVQRAVQRIIETYGQLDVLFNNAGTEGKPAPIESATSADFDDVYAVNVRGTWLAIKYALPHLTRTRGAIVNNTSVVADVGMPGVSIYSASKGAVAALTRAAAIELIKSGVRVNAVSPGPIETEMAERFFGSIDNLRGFGKTAVPAGVTGKPDDIAEAVLYLASPQASFVVGQILTVDGGLIAQ